MMLSIRSTKRLPASLSVPPLLLHHSTASRNTLAGASLCGPPRTTPMKESPKRTHLTGPTIAGLTPFVMSPSAGPALPISTLPEGEHMGIVKAMVLFVRAMVVYFRLVESPDGVIGKDK